MTTIKTKAFMLKINCLELLEGCKLLPIREKNTYFNKIIHFSMQFSAVLNILIVKT